MDKIKELAKLLRKAQKIQKENPELTGFEALEEAKKELGKK
jgi:hypothetical protein